MDYAAFFVALITQLMECLRARPREDIEDSLNEPGFRERRWVCRQLRKQGFTGRELRRETNEAMGFLKDQDAEDVSLLLDDAVELAELTAEEDDDKADAEADAEALSVFDNPDVVLIGGVK